MFVLWTVVAQGFVVPRTNIKVAVPQIWVAIPCHIGTVTELLLVCNIFIAEGKDTCGTSSSKMSVLVIMEPDFLDISLSTSELLNASFHVLLPWCTALKSFGMWSPELPFPSNVLPGANIPFTSISPPRVMSDVMQCYNIAVIMQIGAWLWTFKYDVLKL